MKKHNSIIYTISSQEHTTISVCKCGMTKINNYGLSSSTEETKHKEFICDSCKRDDKINQILK